MADSEWRIANGGRSVQSTRTQSMRALTLTDHLHSILHDGFSSLGFMYQTCDFGMRLKTRCDIATDRMHDDETKRRVALDGWQTTCSR